MKRAPSRCFALEATSLRDAFEKTKAQDLEREKRGGRRRRLRPQVYFGEQLEKQLAIMSKDRSQGWHDWQRAPVEFAGGKRRGR